MITNNYINRNDIISNNIYSKCYSNNINIIIIMKMKIINN